MWVNGVPFGTEGPPVPPGRLLLRLRPALVPLPARLRLRRRRALADRRRARRTTCTAGCASPAPGARATAAATGHLSVLLGIFVALKAVAYWLDRYGLAVKSSDFKADRTTGRACGTSTPTPICRRRRSCSASPSICAAAVLRHAVAAHLAAAGHRLRPDGALGDPDRRALPGDRAEVPGPAERAGQGSAVRPEEHRGDARGVRHRRRRGRRTTRARATPTDKTKLRARRRHHGQHPRARPERRLADVPAAPADAGTTTQFPTDAGRRPLQARTARSRTRSSVCAS